MLSEADFMNTVVERLETPVNYECDVLVAGGGVAGVSAALAAARAGAEVILLERGFMLGGLATAGLVTIYLPLCDGEGRQASYGIAEELLKLSIEHGDEGRYPTAWLDGGSLEERKKSRYEVQFNPHLFAISAERLLVSEGVRIFYGTTAVSVSKSYDRVYSVIIESKSGREAIRFKGCVVDASGDADLAHLSGAKCREYARENTLAAWYYWDKGDGVKLKQYGFCDSVLDSDNARAINNNRYTGLTLEDVSRMSIDAHSAIEADILKRRAAGEDKLFPSCIASIPQVRMTRCLVGKYEMTTGDEGKYFSDSVGTFSNWRRRGPVYELPFSALYGDEVKNLLAVGRCLSSDDDMWDITRVIPVCAVSGEAAGTAAAMTDDLTALDISNLQSALKARGVRVHIDEL